MRAARLQEALNIRTLDLRNENYLQYFQHLQGRIPGSMVSGTPGNYALSLRSGGLKEIMFHFFGMKRPQMRP